MEKITKKINKKIFQIAEFFKQYLAQIVFLIIVLAILVALRKLPYFNIINFYFYYVFAILWILILFLFKKYVTNRKTLVIGISMFVIAMPVSIVRYDSVGEILGFAAFILILIYVLRQLFTERNTLKN